MSATEYFLRLLAALRPLLPGAIATVVCTVAAALLLFFTGRSAWVQHKGFSLPSLFFSLNGLGILRISCSWIKLIFILTYLVSFRKLVLIQYVLLAVTGLLFALCSGSVKGIASGILWTVLQIMGTLCASLVCGYIRDTAPGLTFLLIYLAMALFLALLGMYLFLLDIISVSENRLIDPSRIWRRENHAE